MIALGVDPGCSATGIAVVDTVKFCVLWQKTLRKRELAKRGSLTMEVAVKSALVDLILRWQPTVAVLQTPIFKGRGTPLWNKSAVSVMKNVDISAKLAGYLEGIGLKVILVPPKRNSGMKMDAALFAKIFHYEGRTSQHVRDAANLTRCISISLEGL